MRRYTVSGQTFDKPGRALDLSGYTSISITNCQFIGTAGIFIQASSGSTIRILNNRVTNVLRTKDMDYAQFVQISGLDGSNLPKTPVVIDCQISGNTVVNEPGKCDVEDNINLIAVQGTRDTPIIVYRNSITGAYPADLSDKSLNDYSGGGIICDRGACWVAIRKNTVTETTNYGIAIAGGCNNSIYQNLVTAKAARNVGIYRNNQYTPDPFTGNVVDRNFVNWMTTHGRNDYWLP